MRGRRGGQLRAGGGKGLSPRAQSASPRASSDGIAPPGPAITVLQRDPDPETSLMWKQVPRSLVPLYCHAPVEALAARGRPVSCVSSELRSLARSLLERSLDPALVLPRSCSLQKTTRAPSWHPPCGAFQNSVHSLGLFWNMQRQSLYSVLVLRCSCPVPCRGLQGLRAGILQSSDSCKHQAPLPTWQSSSAGAISQPVPLAQTAIFRGYHIDSLFAPCSNGAWLLQFLRLRGPLLRFALRCVALQRSAVTEAGTSGRADGAREDDAVGKDRERGRSDRGYRDYPEERGERRERGERGEREHRRDRDERGERGDREWREERGRGERRDRDSREGRDNGYRRHSHSRSGRDERGHTPGRRPDYPSESPRGVVLQGYTSA